MEETQIPKDEFSRVVISLMKGVMYQDADIRLWQELLTLQARVRDYVGVLGLTLMLDEAEGCAWLRTRDPEEGREPLPRLVGRRPLSFPVSLLIALLRRKLAEYDAVGSESRLVMTHDEIADTLRTFLPAGANEARLTDQIDAHINKTVEMGFLRRLNGKERPFEVRRLLKLFVDAQWLYEFDARLKEYRCHIGAEGPSVERGD
jgi:hypothetical protein